jgi:hypothetical protein
MNPKSLIKFYAKGSGFLEWNVRAALRMLVAFCLLMNAVGLGAEPAQTKSVSVDNPQQDDVGAERPSPPSELHGGLAGPTIQTAPSSPFHTLLVLFTGLLITAAGLRIKFRHFIGLGVFTNWYSALFLATRSLICGFPQMSVSTLASHVTPATASGIADTVGVALAFLLGVGVRSPKPPSGGEAAPATRSGSNVILAVIEDGIRDQIVTRLQSVMLEDARRYSWPAIEHAGQRVVDEEVAVGRLPQ